MSAPQEPIRTGWMEKRQQERIDASIKVSYHLVPKEGLLEVMNQPAYRDSTADHLPELSKKSSVIHAVTQDVSMGGLSLVGQDPFPVSSALEVHLYLPAYPSPVTLLAEVMRSSPFASGVNGQSHRAGLKILAINRKDVIRIEKFLLEEKLRQKNGRR
ncbi:MAG TPA: PilZ domain-containing protein [bacterium]|nr:PilZ domain-containing protein [bacterium]